MGKVSLALALTALVACIGLLVHSSPALAQQPASPRQLGVLMAGSWTEERLQAFGQGFRDAGYVEGRDIQLQWRHAHGNYSQLAQFEGELRFPRRWVPSSENRGAGPQADRARGGVRAFFKRLVTLQLSSRVSSSSSST